MRRAAAGLSVLVVFTGCFGSDHHKPATNTGSVATKPPNRSITARCEGLGPGPGWRREAIDIGKFGLLVRHLFASHKNRNGDWVVKMGAVVEGHTPVTLRVPEAARGRVGLAYGNGVGAGTPIPEAPVAVTFMPCADRARSGYVGGLLLETVSESVTLEVKTRGSRIETLTIPPAPSG